MKRLITVVSILAIINLLGILGAIGWLVATQRLDRERLDAVREILHQPIPESLQDAEPTESDGTGEVAAISEDGLPPETDGAALPDGPPLPAEQLISLQKDLERATEFRQQRADREGTVLTATSRLVFRQLDEERRKLETERDRFERRQAGIAALRGDEQFQAALSVLSSVKPADAQSMLQEIIEGRAGALSVDDPAGMTGMDRAVAYLDELDDMIRGKIMAEFVKASPTVAAELLERLRTFGLMAEAAGPQTP